MLSKHKGDLQGPPFCFDRNMCVWVDSSSGGLEDFLRPPNKRFLSVNCNVQQCRELQQTSERSTWELVAPTVQGTLGIRPPPSTPYKYTHSEIEILDIIEFLIDINDIHNSVVEGEGSRVAVFARNSRETFEAFELQNGDRDREPAAKGKALEANSIDIAKQIKSIT